MLVKMLGEVSGTRNGVLWPPIGHLIELPDDEAIPLIDSRMAIPAVDPEAAVERAVRDERAVEKRRSAREALTKQV